MRGIRCLPAVCCALGLAVVPPPTRAADPALPKLAVVIGPKAGELERYAADQLCDYLAKLYGVKVRPATSLPGSADLGLLLGSPETNPAVAAALGAAGWPQVSDQGLVLKRARLEGKPVLVVGGGSPRATMWAAFELVEQWGVRYLLHGDVLPEKPGRFRLPDKDVTLEPKLKIRQWRVVNEHAMGPVSWGLADYRPVLDQLAKLKFNRVFVYIWPLQPFVHFEAGGVARRSAALFFGLHFPITDDMPGRQLFGKEKEFWNPDLPLGAGYKDLTAAGERHIHGLISHARRRGMQCVTVANLGEFPPEFGPLLKKGQKTIGVGDPTLVPGADTAVDDPALTELASAVLRATVDTYPEADFIDLSMQEHRQWAGQYERAWKVLDRKYDIAKVRSLAEVLQAAGRRTTYPGGAARAVQEVKGDVVALYFYDRLLNDLKVLKGSRRPDMRFVYDAVAEELFPVLPRLVPAGSETLNFVDYTASRVVRRRDVLKDLPSGGVPSTLIYTLHDDNVGVLPQLATGSLHELTRDLRRHGWAGFSTRYWLLGDHEPCIAYLARAAWNEATTPEAVYRDQVAAVCGAAAVDDMLAVFREVEATTLGLEEHGLGLTFPVPGMMMQHWTPSPLSAELAADRRGYRRALEAARRARDKARPAGRGYVEYWVGRLEFGIGYLDAVEEVRAAAVAEKAGQAAEARQHAGAALEKARAALEAYTRVARDRSDRGAIAVMAEFVYRPLKSKVASLREADPAKPKPKGEDLGWKPHAIKQGDGRGGWVLRAGECRFLHKPGGQYTMPFGLAQMDNGEVILAASWHPGKEDKPSTPGNFPEKPMVAFSRNRGDTWTEFAPIPGGVGRPVMLTYLGKGDLMFQSDGMNPVTQFFSKDYGRTWPDPRPLQPAANKGTHVDGKLQPGYWGAEGNNLVDRDKKGLATRVAQIGWNYDAGTSHPLAPANGLFRSSSDGGRTWSKEILPAAWRYREEHEGKKYKRGVSEGSLVRAANGWIVAALRTDMPPRYFGAPNNDSLEGTGVSISKDDGATWSPIRTLYDAGRHHAHLVRLPNGDLVMTLIVRADVQDGRLASYRRGCEAVVSHDNGLTWDLGRKYVLDEYEYFDGKQWFNGECGHLSTALLDDGSLLTCYGNYLAKGACLIRWRPNSDKK